MFYFKINLGKIYTLIMLNFLTQEQGTFLHFFKSFVFYSSAVKLSSTKSCPLFLKFILRYFIRFLQLEVEVFFFIVSADCLHTGKQQTCNLHAATFHDFSVIQKSIHIKAISYSVSGSLVDKTKLLYHNPKRVHFKTRQFNIQLAKVSP